MDKAFRMLRMLDLKYTCQFGNFFKII